MTEQLTDPQKFFDILKSHFNDLEKTDPLYPLKLKAWNRLKEKGLPTKSVEAYRYIKLRQLYSQTYEPCLKVTDNPTVSSLPECKTSFITIVNGRFAPELSNLSSIPKKVVILPLNEAMRSYGTFLHNNWEKMLKEESDPFALCNAALHTHGLFIYVPPKTIIDTPIQLIFITNESTPSLCHSRVHLFAAPQSELHLITTHLSPVDNHHFINHVIDLNLEEDAHIQYHSTIDNLPLSWQFSALRAGLKRNASLTTAQYNEGSATLRQDYRISLLGENSEALLNSLWLLNSKQESHSHVLIDHQAPHCHSHQLFKGVLNDMGRSSFEGKIMVRKEAQKTEAFQMNPNLILSDLAHADSKPNLEIFADDVKASHGATIGQLDDDQLFYMLTRGLDASLAKNLLIQGFCEEIFTLFPESIQKSLMEKIRKITHV